MQKLIDITCEVCRADTAGLSLLEIHNGEEPFRWEALAGRYAAYRNHTMPRNASPCGTTVDRNVSQLMYMAERIFPALKADPPVVEALLLPFSLHGKTVGTIWVVAHDERRKFDLEDERIVTTWRSLRQPLGSYGILTLLQKPRRSNWKSMLWN